MAELKKYLNERGLREVWDIINGQNSLIVSKIKDIQKRTTVGLYADSTSGWAENESKISEAGALYIYTDAGTFNGKVIAKVKIGDGTSSLADLSFIDASYSAHIADRDIHFTAEERAQWNNEISAFVTAAEESANTAGEAASRAETAKTAAETARDTAVSAKERANAFVVDALRFANEADKSAQNAQTSEQNAAKSAERAEGAEQGAISNANKAGDYATKSGDSANNAGIAANRAQDFVRDAAGQADRATVAANRAETAAQTAKTNADSTTADRQAVQEMATQVTADKATVADHAAKVAEDRTVAETAAQTAQAVADSLPDDYVTAVGKIAENTAEINNTNTEVSELRDDLVNLQDDYNALFDINNSFNRWNPNDLFDGTLNVEDGTVTEGTLSNTSNYLKRTDNYICSTITQDDGVTVTGNYNRIAQYDTNKNFIKCSYGGSSPILLDDNCEYVRVSIAKSQRNICVYFNSDGTIVAYTPYYEDSKKIKGAYLPSLSVVTSFTGKKMCSFGDSITAHGTWQDTVKNALGLSDWQNCGVSGSMISGSGDNQFHSDTRINAIDNDCDFIVIMGGVNDAVGRAVGEQTLENHSIYQVFGALNVTISKIMYKAKINDGLFSDIDYSGITRFTNRKEFPIYLCTQPIYVNQTLINDGLFEEIQNAIRKCGELWGIPVIDVNRLSRLNKANMGNTYYSPDGLHPNANGGKLLGMCIANGLKNNEPYFD